MNLGQRRCRIGSEQLERAPYFLETQKKVTAVTKKLLLLRVNIVLGTEYCCVNMKNTCIWVHGGLRLLCRQVKYSGVWLCDDSIYLCGMKNQDGVELMLGRVFFFSSKILRLMGKNLSLSSHTSTYQIHIYVCDTSARGRSFKRRAMMVGLI